MQDNCAVPGTSLPSDCWVTKLQLREYAPLGMVIFRACIELGKQSTPPAREWWFILAGKIIFVSTFLLFHCLAGRITANHMWHTSYWYRFSDDYWQEINSWKSKWDGSQHQDNIVPLSYFLFSVLNAFPYQIKQMERGRGRKKEKERVKQDQVSGKILELTSPTIYPTITQFHS